VHLFITQTNIIELSCTALITVSVRHVAAHLGVNKKTTGVNGSALLRK
jgi:hypothetical protein